MPRRSSRLARALTTTGAVCRPAAGSTGPTTPTRTMLEGSYIAARIRSPQQIGGVVPADTDHTSALGQWTHTYGAGASIKVQSFFSLNHRQYGQGCPGRRREIADVDILYSEADRHAAPPGGGWRLSVRVRRGQRDLFLFGRSRRTRLAPFQCVRAGRNRPDRIVAAHRRLEVRARSSSGWNVQPDGPRDLEHRFVRPASVGRGLACRAHARRRSTWRFSRDSRCRRRLMARHWWPASSATPLTGTSGLWISRRDIASASGHERPSRSRPSRAATTGSPPCTPSLRSSKRRPRRRTFSCRCNSRTDSMRAPRGIEVNGRWKPFRRSVLAGSYSYLRIVSQLDPATGDLPAPQIADDFSPKHQWHLRASTRFGARVELSGLLPASDASTRWRFPPRPRADLRLEAALTRRLSIVGAGQNLSARSTHIEGASSPFIAATLTSPRSASISSGLARPRPWTAVTGTRQYSFFSSIPL